MLDTYCSTPLQPARADMSEGALKGAALKALARALVPDADQVQLPAAYLGVVERLHAVLLPLLDPDEESGLLQVGKGRMGWGWGAEAWIMGCCTCCSEGADVWMAPAVAWWLKQ